MNNGMQGYTTGGAEWHREQHEEANARRVSEKIERLEAERDSAYKIADHYRAEREQLEKQNKMLVEALEGAYDYVEEAISRRIEEYGENYSPHRLEYMREVKAACDAELATVKESK